MKASGKILSFIVVLSGFSPGFCGATVYNSDGSDQNVQYVHDNLAQNGDTITIPSGTFTWTAQVNITKAITLSGQGIGITIVKDNDQSGPFLNVSLVANNVSRITGIEMQNGGRTNFANAPVGAFHVT